MSFGLSEQCQHRESKVQSDLKMPRHLASPSKGVRVMHDFEEIVSLFREATQSGGCPLQHQLAAALDRVAATRSSAHKSRLDAYEASLTLFDSYASSARCIDDRHARLALDRPFIDARDTVTRAAACALTEDQPELAIEHLDQGRCTLLAHMTRYRTTVDDIRLQQPALADEFVSLSTALEAIAVTRTMSDESGDPVLRHDHMM